MAGLQRLVHVHLQVLREAEGTALRLDRLLQRREHPLLRRIAGHRILRPAHTQHQRGRMPDVSGRREIARLRLDRIALPPLEDFRIDREFQALLHIPASGRSLVGPARQHGLRRILARGMPRRDNHVAHAVVVFRRNRQFQSLARPDQAVAVVSHQRHVGRAIRLHLQNAARSFLLDLPFDNQHAIFA